MAQPTKSPAAGGGMNMALAGVDALVSISGAFDARRVASANAKAARITQAANNRLEAARAAAYARVQAENNRRRLNQGGKEVTAISQTRARLAEASTQGSIRDQVIASEQLGALTVAAAAAGQGGSSIRLAKQAMMRTVAETAARREVAEARQLDDLTGQQGDAIYNAVTGQDYSYNPATMDYTAHMKPGSAGIWNEVFKRVVSPAKEYVPTPAQPKSTLAPPSMVNNFQGQSYAAAQRSSINSIGTMPVMIK